jgi:hypothetical protein
MIDWHPVRTQPIPKGFPGRNLTRTECARLRARGHRCSPRDIVMRHADSPSLGIVYRPAQGGGFTHAGIDVTRRTGGF